MKDKETLRKKMFRLMLPMAFQQFMLALVGACDAVMLGKLNQDSMAAVSLASQVTFVFNLFMAAFIIGENMFVAQYFGKKDFAGISKVCSLVLRTSCITAVIFMVVSILSPQNIMRFFTNEANLIVLGSEYLRWVGASWFLSAVSQVYLTFMKNCGAVNLSTVISSTTVVLNIVLNAILIFGLAGFPAMGISGAALATVIATAVQTVWCTVYVTVRRRELKIHIFERDTELEKRFFHKTAPVLLNELAWGGGFTMYSVVMGHLGADAVAANSIANISKNLVVCFCYGLGGAGSIIVGNELGANRFEEAKSAGRTLIGASVLCGILTGLVLLAISPLIVRMVDLMPVAGEYLKWMLVMCSYYLAGKSINSMTIGGIFPAGGDSRFGLLCDAVTLWCITVPLGCLCAFVFKLPVLYVYFVLNLDEIVKLPVVFRHYRKYGWVKNIT